MPKAGEKKRVCTTRTTCTSKRKEHAGKMRCIEVEDDPEPNDALAGKSLGIRMKALGMPL